MNIFYRDCAMGAAGDMLMAALLELLPDRDAFLRDMNALGLPGIEVTAEPSVKCGVTGTHVHVFVHGEEEAQKAEDAAKALFATGGSDENMPTTELTEAQLTDGKIAILDLMLACELIPSKGEGRRLVQQGGVMVNDQKVSSIDESFTGEQLREGLKIRKGKKVFHKAIMK